MSFLAHVPAGGWERICDVCGIRRDGRRLRTVGKYMVCEKHPKWVPREQLERLSPIGGYGVESVKNPSEFAPRDSFEVAEGEVFDFLVRDTTLGDFAFDVRAGKPATSTLTNVVEAVGWQGIYLYELIAEAARPARWISDARVRLRQVAEWLVTRQEKGPFTSGANSDLLWGAYKTAASIT
ncbi:MAG TPA: hypothetical protein VEJ18_10570, partial [Planctomycetota bacterium]|nr:hypothetical protein [Planctomycetota bacterium]